MLMKFDGIPFKIETEKMLRALGLGEYFFEEIDEMVRRTNAIGRPKAVAKRMEVGDFDGGGVNIGGQYVESRLVSSLIRGRGEVFGYVATCGRELEDVMNAVSDPVEKMWQARINQEAMSAAVKFASDETAKRFSKKSFCSVNPGSNPDWPLEAQKLLFSMIGEVGESTGVTLTESLLMLPTKSVSGIWFESEKEYSNCSVCSRGECMGRREPFSPKRYGEIFAGV